MNSGEERTHIQESLKKKNVPTMVYYPKPMHKQTAFSDLPDRSGKLRVSSKLSDTVLSIPMHPYLTAEEVEYIAKSLLEI